MKGSIRFVLGMLITFGAVGTIDANPDANLIVQGALAVLGLGIMSSGIAAFEKEI